MIKYKRVRSPSLLVAALFLLGACGGNAPSPQVTTPASCLRAIEEARDFGMIMAEFADLQTEWSDIARQGLNAGLERDYVTITALTARVEQINEQTSTLTERLDEIEFASYADDCENA